MASPSKKDNKNSIFAYMVGRRDKKRIEDGSKVGKNKITPNKTSSSPKKEDAELSLRISHILSEGGVKDAPKASDDTKHQASVETNVAEEAPKRKGLLPKRVKNAGEETKEDVFQRDHSDTPQVAPIARVKPSTRTTTSATNKKQITETPETKEETWLPSIRTYKSDIAAAVKSGKHTLTSIVAAESKKRRTEERVDKHPNGKKKVLRGYSIMALGTLFIIGGAFLGWYSFVNVRTSPLELVPEETRSIIFTEEEQVVVLPRVERKEIDANLSKLFNESVPAFNTMKRLFLADQEEPSFLSPEKEPRLRFLSSREILSVLSSSAPPSFLRTLDSGYAFGFHTLDRNYPFLVLKVTSFENAFAGLLRWERSLVRDVAPLFRIKESDRALRSEPFEDVVIKNYDTRMVTNEEGAVILFYAFIDRETLVFATNVITFDEVVKRLKTPRRVTK